MRAEHTGNGRVGAALVVGGGIGGMQAALDLTAAGIKVYLVESKPSIGGKMAQLDKTFPTNDCAMCTMAPRLVEIGGHQDVEILTLSEVESLSGEPGRFSVTVKKRPRYVDATRCNGCGACVESCPTRNTIQIRPWGEVVLPPETRAAVNAILERHRTRDGPLMPILQEVNERFNYFPDGVLAYISQHTGYPLTHLYRIATFYSAFSIVPRGRRIIKVCMGTACYVSGGGRVMDRIGDKLGIEPEGTTADMEFTLKPVRCIGCCGLAPALMVGDTVHGKVTGSQVAGILERHRGT